MGIVAVDPTSPFTGGAILGDRVRMQSHAAIRACSSGAWRRAATSAAWPAPRADAAIVLDASGRDIVIIETVGVGQDEVDIVRTADVSDRGARPGHRRRGAGAQGRHHGDRRHLRREQGRPGRRGPHGRRRRGDAEPRVVCRPASGVRRSSRPRRRPAPECRRSWRPSSGSGGTRRSGSGSGGARGASSGCASSSPPASWRAWTRRSARRRSPRIVEAITRAHARSLLRGARHHRAAGARGSRRRRAPVSAIPSRNGD